MWQVLLVKYNIKGNPFVCVCVSLSRPVKKLILVYFYNALADSDTMSLKWLGQLFHEWTQWFEFWGTLSQYLTSTYTVSICPGKELQGQKLTSTYLPGWLIGKYIRYTYICWYYILLKFHGFLQSYCHTNNLFVLCCLPLEWFQLLC